MKESTVYNITSSDLAAILEARDEIVYNMRQSVDRHFGSITAELYTFDKLSPLMRARHAIVFSIISPKCPIERNALVTPVIVRAIMDGVRTAEEFRAILLSYGIGLQNVKSARIAKLAERLYTMTSADMVRDDLASWPGLSMKTASMATALYDQNAEVYTLDTHMLRWMCKMAGLNVQPGTYACSNANRYRAIERMFVELANVHCDDAPIFLTQWAIWNDAGFDGVHQCHLPIFGLAAD